MKRLDAILKQTGLNSAISEGKGETELKEEGAKGQVCRHCGGAGFIRKGVPLGHPDFGLAFPCECALEEGKEARLARLERYSNLGSLLRLSFDNLVARGRTGDIQDQERFAAAVTAAQQFAQQPSGWLVFTGPSGCGKTHLAAAIANRCLERGCPALFVIIPDLLDHLRAAYRPDSPLAYDQLFEQVRNAPILILDDFGAQTFTPWAQEKLFQLVNHRFNAQMPTVFTTVLDLKDLDERFQTRLCDPSLSRVWLLEPAHRRGTRGIDSLGQPLLRNMTFKNFDAQLLANDAEDLKLIQGAYRQAMKFAENPQDWLVLAGSPGRGKTRLAAAIANYRRETGQPVLFVIVPDLLDHLRSSFNPQNPAAYDKVFEEVRTAPLLILDDLGAHTSTAWADEKLFQIINYRYNSCLPTVITTSLIIRDLDGRLVSRLTDPQVSTILLMGKFDFWGKEQVRQPPSRPGRPRRRP